MRQSCNHFLRTSRMMARRHSIQRSVMKGIFEPSRPTCSARAYASTNTLAEFTSSQLRNALIAGQRAPGKSSKFATLAPARHAHSHLVPANSANTKRRSGMVVRFPKPAELHELLKRRVRFAIFDSSTTSFHVRLQRIQRPLGNVSMPNRYSRPWSAESPGHACWQDLVLHRADHCVYGAAVGRLRSIASPLERMIATVGCHNLKQARSCMFHKISTSMARTFNTVPDEPLAPPHSRRLLGFPPEKLRSTVNAEAAKSSRWSRTRDGSNWGDVWSLRNRLRQRRRYLRLLRMPLCASGAVASPDTTVATA